MNADDVLVIRPQATPPADKPRAQFVKTDGDIAMFVCDMPEQNERHTIHVCRVPLTASAAQWREVQRKYSFTLSSRP